ncbi:hypothetical protein H9Q09_00930 [Aurantimonas sp. DM33-3]|uniref:hypothetical protein n=1 Tax=Aurantimonas sp. DM33-3 TaxID=2766955 RepID=UPI0016528E22|nr:hypothetical protein [Aurantimonas sp. DM33-3]MBC6714748.1 hypothetical protein [Aurantimonas sp. DM33-3]
MNVFYVCTTHTSAATGRPSWYFFEADVAGLAELTQRLNDGELIYGHVLNYTRDPDGDEGLRIVVGAREHVLSKHEVKNAAVPHCRFVRYEDEGATLAVNEVRP